MESKGIIKKAVAVQRIQSGHTAQGERRHAGTPCNIRKDNRLAQAVNSKSARASFLGVTSQPTIESQAIEGAKHAQALEALPAGQCAFRGKAWTRKALAGKVDALTSLPICQLDDNAIVYELVGIAGRYLPADKIHVDETINDQLWHRSRVRWDADAGKPIDLEAYYHNKAVRLPVLAHEVGHLETLPKLGNISFYCSSDSNRYHAEVQASRWAIKFLAERGLTGKAYAEAVNLLQGCLDNYKRELGVKVRYVLDYNVENKNKKVRC